MGPVVSAELRRLASTGEIRPEDLVWREGLTEWTLARNVRGLFEEEAHAAAVIADVLSSGAAGTPSSVASAATAKRGGADEVAAAQTARTPRRHLFDVLLDGLRARFAAAFVEKTAKVFRAAGSYGLFLAMLLVAAYMVIAAVKVQRLESLPSGLLVLLVLVALQYVAGKFCDALEHLNRTTASNLSSSASRLLRTAEPGDRPGRLARIADHGRRSGDALGHPAGGGGVRRGSAGVYCLRLSGRGGLEFGVACISISPEMPAGEGAVGWPRSRCSFATCVWCSVVFGTA